MGGQSTGRPPKDPAVRARTNRPSTNVTVEVEPAQKPMLGLTRPDGVHWKPESLQAWEEWWTSPIADRWIEAYVPTMRALIVLYDDFWQAPDAQKRIASIGEFRMLSREYGLSVMSARSLGWEIKRPVKRVTADAPLQLPAGADPRKVLQMGRRRSA